MSLVRVKVPDDDDDEGLERKESAGACEKLKNSLFARSFFSWLAARVGFFQVFLWASVVLGHMGIWSGSARPRGPTATSKRV